MRWTTTLAVMALAAAGLAGCGSGDDTRDTARSDDTPAETPIADSLKQPMDKARAVEDAAMQRKADMDKRLAEMEGDADDEP